MEFYSVTNLHTTEHFVTGLLFPNITKLPRNVFSKSSHYPSFHCAGRAINQLAQAMFLVHSRDNDVEERLKEFLALASSSLLRLGHENEKEAIRTRESVYLLLHIIVQESNVCLALLLVTVLSSHQTFLRLILFPSWDQI